MSPDLTSLLEASAPSPGDGADLDDIRGRVRRRRATRLATTGAASIAVALAVGVVAVNWPSDVPVPDVVNTPGASEPSQPDTDPNVGTWTPPLLSVVGLSESDAVIHHSGATDVELVADVDEEQSSGELDVVVVGDTLVGAWLSSIGESDDIWWFRTDANGLTTHARLPAEFQATHRGGASEIGWPRPVWSPGGDLLAYVEAQGSSPDVGGDGFASTIRLVTFGADGTPADVAGFRVPKTSAFLVAADLGHCPGRDELLCLLTLDGENLREFRITTDGALALENAPTQLDDDDVMAANVLAAASTTSSDGATSRWILQEEIGGLRLTDLDDPRVALPISTPTASGDFRWFDVLDDTAIIVTDRGSVIVDLESGRFADGPDEMTVFASGSLVGLTPAEP